MWTEGYKAMTKWRDIYEAVDEIVREHIDAKIDFKLEMNKI